MTILKSFLSMSSFLFCFSVAHAEFTETKDKYCWDIQSAIDSIPSHFEEIIFTQNPLFIKAKLNGKWGTIGLDGETIIPFEYEKIELGGRDDPYLNQLVYVTKGKYGEVKKGLMTLTGEVLLPTRFESLKANPTFILSGPPKLVKLFGVKVDGKWGYAKKGGEMAIACKYDYGSIFYKGRAVVSVMQGEEKGSYLINEKGEVLTKESYAYIRFYGTKEDKGEVKSHDGKLGVINLDGEVVIPVIYDKMNTENSYRVRKGGISDYLPRNSYQVQDNFIRVTKEYEGYGLLNEKGELLLPCNSRNGVFRYYFGLSSTQGLSSFQGDLLLSSEYEKASAYYQNYYIVYKNNKAGIMDILTEEIILPCEYDKIYSYSKTCSLDLFNVKKGVKHGLVNRANEVVIPIEYENIRRNNFYDIILVTKNNKTAIWDIRGNPVTDFEFDGLWGEHYEPFLAKKGTKYGYVDRTGKELLPFVYEKASGFFPVDGFGNLDKTIILLCNGEDKDSELLTILKTGELESRYMNVRGDTLGLVPSSVDGVEVFFEKGEDNEYRIYIEKEGQGKIYGNDIDQEILAKKMVKNHGFMFVNNFALYCLKNHRTIWVEEMQDIRELNRPICWIKTDGQYYFINNLGEKVNNLSFDKIGEESEGLTAVAKDGKIGFINEKVELIIPYDFDITYNQVPPFEFKKGISIAFKNKKYGFIDKKGKTLIPFHFEAICYFDGEMGIGYREGKWEKVDF